MKGVVYPVPAALAPIYPVPAKKNEASKKDGLRNFPAVLSRTPRSGAIPALQCLEIRRYISTMAVAPMSPLTRNAAGLACKRNRLPDSRIKPKERHRSALNPTLLLLTADVTMRYAGN